MIPGKILEEIVVAYVSCYTQFNEPLDLTPIILKNIVNDNLSNATFKILTKSYVAFG